MKKRIEQLLNGKFEYETAAPVLLPEELSIQVVPGETAGGSFWIESPDGKKIRGFLYSSNPRVVMEPSEFQGVRNEIRFQADGNGLPEGERETGEFTICCELGEYTLPYTLSAAEKVKKTKEPFPFQTMGELAVLAQSDFQKAYRYFIEKDFREFLAVSAPELGCLYDALAESPFSYQTFEEFLTGAGLKEEIRIETDRDKIVLERVSETLGEPVRIQKNGWGFQKISIESDNLFVRPERRLITTDEFAGSSYELNLIIDANFMHAGNNYARVTLSTPYQRAAVEVTAVRDVQTASERMNHTCRMMRKNLENLYIRFRLKKLDLAAWVEQSVSVIGSYHRAGGRDLFADLMLVQLHYADGKRQKARRILETVEAHRDELKTDELYGFYLYLTTFFYQEASYVDQVEAEIRTLFYRDKTNWKLQWILLYLQESLLNDDNAKYEAVAEQFRYGCRSRIMYLEAYQILTGNPFLMRHISSFELQILRFAQKEKVLTVEMTRQMANLAAHYGKYSSQLLSVLTGGYEQFPSQDLIRAICLLLMKGERRDAAAFIWYEKGVNAGLRITGLYEYYMESTPNHNLMDMPQIIRMYFVYDTTLDYRKRAAIYRCIVDRKDSDPQTYRTYRAAMEKFASDQLEMGRITDDLAILYRSFIRKGLLSKQMAEQLTRLLFTYEIRCDSPEICSVTVHSEHLVQEHSAVFNNGRAQIAVYDPDSILVLENKDGERFTADGLIQKRKVFESREMLDWCVQTVPDFAGIVLFICCGCVKEKIVTHNSLPYLRMGSEMEAFALKFRNTLRGQVLHFYADHPREESLSEFLDQIEYLDYVKVDKSSLISLLAEEGRCSDAFSLLDLYGAEGIPMLQLVRICSRMIIDLEFEENHMLISLCWYCFSNEKYNDKLLRYLLLYYEGSIKEMKRIWDAARGFDLDTMLLEEKIITMILFTRSGTEGSEQIFESYAKKMGRKKLCRAYLNLKAYEYFVKGLPTGDIVFRAIEKDYIYLSEQGRTAEQEEVCRLALLQHYSGAAFLSGEQRTYAAQMLAEFNVKGMRFAFWKKFDRELLKPYQMEGRVFVEYVGNPDSAVTICYRRSGSEEEYKKETVKNCFEGIFVKEFILFYGDELECWLEENGGSEQKKTDKRILSWPQDEEAGGSSQYELINRISKAQQENDSETLETELDNYLMLEHLAREVFTII